MKRAHTLGLIGVFAAEFALFYVTTLRHSAWIYPRWWDQLQYLSEAYRGYEYRLEHGFLSGLGHALTNTTAQGTLHGVWTLFIFSAFGPSRMGALTLNLVAFVALQAATFLAVRRISGSHPIAWASVALLAALRCPWSGESGSVIDFRLDWMAACTYGIALSTAIAGNGFRSTRWAFGFGCTVGLVLLTRSLTVVYFAAIYPILFVALLTHPDRWARSGRLILSGAVAAAMAGPFFWLKRQAIYDYYWIGHITGPERALRDSHLGATASVRWILSELFATQLGLAATALGLGVAGALLALRWIPRLRAAAPSPAPLARSSAWLPALVFFAAPAAVLSGHALKAPQPVSILLPGAVWLAILSWLQLSRAGKPGAVAFVSGGAVLAGALLFVAAITRTTDSKETELAARKLNALADFLYFRAEACGLTEPRVGVTLISEGFNPVAFSVLGYERHHRWLQFEYSLSTSLFTQPREKILPQLGQSDFVCLLTGDQPPSWPSDRQMAGLSPVLREWCQANMRYQGKLAAMGFSVEIYERTALERSGGGRADTLAPWLDGALSGPPRAEAVPPAAPFFQSPSFLVWSAKDAFSYRVRAAYSPVRYAGVDLPAGLSLDARTGVIRGPWRGSGAFTAKIIATNPAGSSAQSLMVRVEDQAFFGELRAPSAGLAGRPIDIEYAAFDTDGRLNFIDVTDLTAGKTLDRLLPGDGQGKAWQGRYRLTLPQLGKHTILLRFFRLRPGETPYYSYCDRPFEIAITPPP